MPDDHVGSGTFVPPVDQDRLWKANVRKTMNNQLTIWPRRWSFLVREYEKMHEAMEGKRPLSPYTGIATWPRWHGCHVESTTKQEKPEKKKPEKKTKKREVEKLQLPPIKAVPPRKCNLPRTTSGWYGYSHLHNGHNLVSDRQRWTKAQAYQHDLIKLLKWPMDYYD